MKVVVLFALAVVVLQIEAKPLRLKRDATDVQIALKCIEELNLDKAKISAAIRQDDAPEDDEDFAEFMKCSWLKKNYLHRDGSVNYDALKKMIIDIYAEDFNSEYSRQIAETVLHDCRNFHETGGLGAIKVGNCIMRNIRNMNDV